MVPAQNSLMTKKIFCAIIIAGCFLACKKEETTNYTTEQVINGVNIYPAPPSKWLAETVHTLRVQVLWEM